MLDGSTLALRLLSSLAIGLLIGAERERRKGEGPSRSAAGIRTFAIVALIGAVSLIIGGYWLLAVAVIAVATLSTVAYLRSGDDDPGLTTETALLATALLGALAVSHPGLSAGLAVAIAILLAARERLHTFVSRALSERELNDGLIFAAGVFVILPLIPNRYIGPFHAINPHTIWLIVILMMMISAAGYVAVRLLGAKFGLPLAGLASGFVSSTATISAMGARALQQPELSRPAVAGAVLSTVATIIELAIVLAATSRSTLIAMARPLITAGAVAVAYGVLFTVRSMRSENSLPTQSGRAFSLGMALIFAGTIGLMLLISGALDAWLGGRGVIIAAAIAGFADTHSPSVSVASLVAAGSLSINDATFGVLAALTTNTVTKIILAITSGRQFGFQVIPGLLLVIASAWASALFLG